MILNGPAEMSTYNKRMKAVYEKTIKLINLHVFVDGLITE